MGKDINEPNEEFQIKDRRRFNPDGSMKDETSEEGSPKKSPETPEAPPAPKQPSINSQSQEPDSFELDFSTFLLSLASSAQMALGAIPHPATGKSEVSLVSAKQTIEILSMIETKTKGNLTSQEEALFKRVLYDLRMAYVAVQQEINNQTKK